MVEVGRGGGVANSESEQIFDGGQTAVCQDAIKPAGCIAPSAKSISVPLITVLRINHYLFKHSKKCVNYVRKCAPNMQTQSARKAAEFQLFPSNRNREKVSPRLIAADPQLPAAAVDDAAAALLMRSYQVTTIKQENWLHISTKQPNRSHDRRVWPPVIH